MTYRVTIGIDPGQTGALAVLADGEFDRFIDMPTVARRAGGLQINAAGLAASLRGLMHAHRGAYTLAILEQVGAMPKQGVASTFRFGQSDGVVRGVLGALGIGFVEVPAATWKRHLHLLGADKDAARAMAIQRFPAAAAHLARKKDVGRADAALIALWAQQTEQVACAA